MRNSAPFQEGLAKAQSGAETALLKLEDFLPHRLNVLSSLVSHALTRVYGRETDPEALDALERELAL